MMGVVVLVNDVNCQVDDYRFVVGDDDIEVSEEGINQSRQLVESLHAKAHRMIGIAASDLNRIVKIVHYLKMRSPDKYLEGVQVKYSDSLRERSFGVLNCSVMSWSSDVFRESRIAAEGGESVAQCRDRLVKFLNAYITSQSREFIISHPFACQIMSNWALKRNHTALTPFWLKKGSFVIFEVKKGSYGLNWTFQNGFNGIDHTSYTEDDIYSRLLGAEGFSSH